MIDLQSSYQLLGLKNRSVMAPMTRYSCDEKGLPSKELADYYIRRAENDIALIIVESAAINDSDSLGYVGGMQFHSQKHVEKWNPILKEIKANGAKIWLQLFHPGRLTVKEITGIDVISPSSIAPFNSKSFWRPKIDGQLVHFQTKTEFNIPQEISKKQIERIIDQFVSSATKAEEAGFDGVEIHGAHGYLIHQFNSTLTNKRDDEYGVNAQFKFASEIIEKCRRKVDFIISFRVSNHLVDNSYVRYNTNEYNIPKLIEKLDHLGVDVFHTSELEAGSKMFGVESSLSGVVSEHTSKPLIVTGRVDTLERANQLLCNKGVELIGFGRNLISNPNLMELLKANNTKDIRKFDYINYINKIY
jgi:N-ethylmaleimide reductase